MLQRLYPAVIFSLLLFSAMQWAQINGLHSDLKEAKETLETRNEELKEAREEIDDQNVLIEAAEAKAEAAQAKASERSTVVMAALPSAIQQDKASPATADALNEWMESVF